MMMSNLVEVMSKRFSPLVIWWIGTNTIRVPVGSICPWLTQQLMSIFESVQDILEFIGIIGYLNFQGLVSCTKTSSNWPHFLVDKLGVGKADSNGECTCISHSASCQISHFSSRHWVCPQLTCQERFTWTVVRGWTRMTGNGSWVIKIDYCRRMTRIMIRWVCRGRIGVNVCAPRRVNTWSGGSMPVEVLVYFCFLGCQGNNVALGSRSLVNNDCWVLVKSSISIIIIIVTFWCPIWFVSDQSYRRCIVRWWRINFRWVMTLMWCIQRVVILSRIICSWVLLIVVRGTIFLWWALSDLSEDHCFFEDES